MLKKQFNSMTLDEIFIHINKIERVSHDLLLLYKQGEAKPSEHRVEKFKELLGRLAQAIGFPWS